MPSPSLAVLQHSLNVAPSAGTVRVSGPAMEVELCQRLRLAASGASASGEAGGLVGVRLGLEVFGHFCV